MILDIIASIGGLIIPPAFNFIKKKFIKSENDTPERTIGDLATTKPEVVPAYVQALSTLLDAKVKFFNRDVIGSPSQWVVDLRAAIRPIGVVLAFGILAYMVYEQGVNVTDTWTGIRISCETMITSWFGSRFTLSK